MTPRALLRGSLTKKSRLELPAFSIFLGVESCSTYSFGLFAIPRSLASLSIIHYEVAPERFEIHHVHQPPFPGMGARVELRGEGLHPHTFGLEA